MKVGNLVLPQHAFAWFFCFFLWVIGLDGALYQVFLVNQSRGVKTDNGGWILGDGIFFPTSLGRQLIF
jgi:hypothetical protein